MTKPEPIELPIPQAALGATKAVEVVRVWIGDKEQHISVKTAWNDPAAWGLLLVDLAKNVAAAYAEAGQFTAEEALARIREGLDAEWAEDV